MLPASKNIQLIAQCSLATWRFDYCGVTLLQVFISDHNFNYCSFTSLYSAFPSYFSSFQVAPVQNYYDDYYFGVRVGGAETQTINTNPRSLIVGTFGNTPQARCFTPTVEKLETSFNCAVQFFRVPQKYARVLAVQRKGTVAFKNEPLCIPWQHTRSYGRHGN